MISFKFFVGVLIFLTLILCYAYADVPSSSGESSKTLQTPASQSYLVGDSNQSLNQSRGSGQSGAGNDKIDSSEIIGTSQTTVTHLNGDQKTPSSPGYVQPTPSFTLLFQVSPVELTRFPDTILQVLFLLQ